MISKPIQKISFGLSFTPTIVLAVLFLWASYGQQSLAGTVTSSSDSALVNDAICGNGLQETGEQCDHGDRNGTEGDSCRSDCTQVRCGDGIVDTDTGEQCDNGSGNGKSGNECSFTCQYRYCGDGKIDRDRGEQCDDRNALSGDGCDANCNIESAFACTGEPSICEASSSSSDITISSSAIVKSSSASADQYSSLSFASSTAEQSSASAASLTGEQKQLLDVLTQEQAAIGEPSLIPLLKRILSGGDTYAADQSKIRQLSAVLDTIAVTRQESINQAFALAADFVTPFTEPFIRATGIDPSALTHDTPSTMEHFTSLLSAPSFGTTDTLLSRVQSDAQATEFLPEQEKIATLKTQIDTSNDLSIASIASLVHLLGAKAIAPEKVPATIAAIHTSAVTISATDIAAYYPRVSTTDLAAALSDLAQASGGNLIDPQTIPAILTAIDHLSAVMKDGGVDLTTLAAQSLQTDQFLRMAGSIDPTQAMSAKQAIDTFAGRLPAQSAALLKSPKKTDQWRALFNWSTSRTPAITQMIGRLPADQRAAMQAQWDDMTAKFGQIASSEDTAAQIPLRAAIEELYAYTDRLQRAVQVHFSPFDRVIDILKRFFNQSA